MAPTPRLSAPEAFRPPLPAACCRPQELGDALHLLSAKAEDEAAAAAADRRRLEGVVKSLEGRLAQVGLCGMGWWVVGGA